MSSIKITEQDLEDFKTESLELLDIAEKRLLGLDTGSDNFHSAYDEIFRAFHSLKGAAGMMELTSIQQHTHELENILVSTKGSPTLSKDLINTFLQGVDKSRDLLSHISQNKNESLVPEVNETKVPGSNEAQDTKFADMPENVLEEFFVESEEILERVSQSLQLIEDGNQTKDLVDGLYRDVHTLKGTSYLFSLDKIGDIAHAMESSLEKVRAGTHLPGQQLPRALFKCLTVIEALFRRTRNKEPITEFESLIKVLSKTLDVFSERLEPIKQKLSTELDAALEEKTIPPINIEIDQTSKISDMIQIPENLKSNERDESAGSIRVPISLLDNLMTLMGEMVLVRNQVLQFSSKSDDMEFISMSKRLNVVTSDIQGEMMKTRMQPIGNILTKFNRVVRDLSHELGKEISLTIQGAETELDKSLLEAIKDPLTHIVRNSCDHGIEVPSKRQAIGKPNAGHISIGSYYEGGQVVIEISDDGKGLNRDILIQKAIEKGLIPASSKLSDKEAFELIFHAGFSTAAAITNVSGRGVGMDVVRTNIEKIGGTVDLSSVLGQGTTIKIKVPLTLAIVPALIIESGGSKFAIPQVKLEELVRAEQTSAENRIEYLHGSPVYRLRGNILPLIELNKVLNLTEKERDKSSATIAVLNAETFSFGVIIDEIHDTADIVVKPLNRLLKSLQVYAGGTILGDGSIALILDVIGLAKHARLGSDKTHVMHGNEIKIEDAEIQKLLLVKVNSPTLHAIDLSYVNRLEIFSKSSIELSGNQPVIRYRDIILPLISANKHLGYLEKNLDTELAVVVVTRAGKLYGVIVDSILDSIQTTAELDKGHFNNSCFFGNFNSDEGLVVVINPFELISQEFPAIAEAEAREAQEMTVRSSALASIKHDGPITILLVEDTAFFRKAIKQVLEEKDYRVITANHGAEALEILGRTDITINMVVSDIEMPIMNGFQMATNIRKNPRYKTIPLLAISSRADKQYRSQGLQAGFNTYLEKLKPPILLAAVKELLSGKKEVA